MSDRHFTRVREKGLGTHTKKSTLLPQKNLDTSRTKWTN